MDATVLSSLQDWCLLQPENFFQRGNNLDCGCFIKYNSAISNLQCTFCDLNLGFGYLFVLSNK